MNIIDWMIKHNYAENGFSANHIFVGLELGKEPRFWKRVRRIVLYRRWRLAGEKSKAAYKHAIDNDPAPVPMFGTLDREKEHA